MNWQYLNAFSGILELWIFKFAPSGQTIVGPRGVTKLQPPQYENASYGTEYIYIFVSNIEGFLYWIGFICETLPLFFVIKVMVYRKNSLQKIKFVFCRLCKNYEITCCIHMTSYAIWVDEITGVMISTKKLKHFEKIGFLNKIYRIFHFLSLCAFISIRNVDRSIPLKDRNWCLIARSFETNKV